MNFFSFLQNSQIQEDASSPYKSKFFQLLDYLKDLPSLNISTSYIKNINSLKKSLKIDKHVPDLAQIETYYKNIFCSKLSKNKSTTLKSFFSKTKILFVWIVSIYELLTHKTFEQFENFDWKLISLFIPQSDFFNLKYKWFSYILAKKSSKIWTYHQDEILTNILKKLYPSLFISPENYGKIKVSWSKISFEMSKDMQSIIHLKTDKQCKERWFNHLNPFLNKKFWSLEDDIRLMIESYAAPKEWSKIARKFHGRTQHHIKNRFICLVSKELDCKRDVVRQLIKNNSIQGIIQQTLKSLNWKKNETCQSPSQQSKEETQIETDKNEISMIEEEKTNEKMSNEFSENSGFIVLDGANEFEFANHFHLDSFNVDAFINFDNFDEDSNAFQ